MPRVRQNATADGAATVKGQAAGSAPAGGVTVPTATTGAQVAQTGTDTATTTTTATTTPVSTKHESGFTSAYDLGSLAAALQRTGYTPRTDEELRRQAEAMYKSQYDQSRLSAQQSYDTTALALQQQLAQLGMSYDRQIEAQKAATQKALSQQDRYSLQRGMQRSSYNNATIGNLQIAGAKAIDQILQGRTLAESQIGQQQTLLAKQLAEKLSAADSKYQADIIARIMEMQDQDWQRQYQTTKDFDDLQIQLYKLMQEDKSLAMQQQKLSADLAQSGSKGSGGYYGGGTSGKSSTSTSTSTAGTQGAGTQTGYLWQLLHPQGGTRQLSDPTKTTTTTTTQTPHGAAPIQIDPVTRQPIETRLQPLVPLTEIGRIRR